MRNPPTARQRTIAARRLQGKALTEIATEFGITGYSVRKAIKCVQDYDRGIVLLRVDPASIEALDLVGCLPSRVRSALAHMGIWRMTDLAGVSMLEMLTWPYIGYRSATMLVELLDEYPEASAKLISEGRGND